MKLKGRFMLWNTVLVAGLLGATLATLYRTQQGILYAQLKTEREQALTRLARICRETLEAKSEPILLNYLKVWMQDPAVLEVGLWDLAGRIQVHSDFLSGDYASVGRRSDDPLLTRAAGSDGVVSHAGDAGGRRRLRLASPVVTRAGRFGTVVVDYDLDRIDQDLQERFRPTLQATVWVGLIALGAGLLAALALASNLAAPIRFLSDAARRIGEGKGADAFDLGRKDELGALARDLGDMARRLKELDRLKDRFLHSVSHDMRTPLAVVQSSLHHAKHAYKRDPDSLQEDFEDMDKAVADLLKFTNDILDLAKLQSNRMKFQMRPLEVAPMLEEAARGLRRLASERGLRLETAAEPGLPAILADRQFLPQVFQNLLTNAVKFTRRGGITLTAKRDGALAHFRVTDTGDGIPKEKLEAVFERFEQVSQHGRTSTGMAGSGLGLAICKEIVERHGGTIWVESQEGKGSTFHFTVPLAGRAAEARA